MMGNSNQTSSRAVIRSMLIGASFTLLGAFVLAYQFLPVDVIELSVGQIAPNDIFAPNQVAYTSDIETNTAQERAEIRRRARATVRGVDQPNLTVDGEHDSSGPPFCLLAWIWDRYRFEELLGVRMPR